MPSIMDEQGVQPVRFESKFYRVSERDGAVVIRAVLMGTHDKPVIVAYKTRDGQVKARSLASFFLLTYSYSPLST